MKKLTMLVMAIVMGGCAVCFSACDFWKSNYVLPNSWTGSDPSVETDPDKIVSDKVTEEEWINAIQNTIKLTTGRDLGEGSGTSLQKDTNYRIVERGVYDNMPPNGFDIGILQWTVADWKLHGSAVHENSRTHERYCGEEEYVLYDEESRTESHYYFENDQWKYRSLESNSGPWFLGLFGDTLKESVLGAIESAGTPLRDKDWQIRWDSWYPFMIYDETQGGYLLDTDSFPFPQRFEQGDLSMSDLTYKIRDGKVASFSYVMEGVVDGTSNRASISFSFLYGGQSVEIPQEVLAAAE